MDRSMPGCPVLHYLPEFAQTHVQWVDNAIQPSPPLLSPSPPALNLSPHQSFPISRLFTSGGQSTGASISASVLPMNIQGDFLWDWLVWSPCGPRSSLEFSPAPQLESVNSLALSLLYGPTPVSAHDRWKSHSFDYMDLCWQNDASAFECVCHSFPSKEQASFNFMAAVTVCSHFGAQDNKICHCFHFFPSIYCEDWMTWSWVFNVEFPAGFFTLLFHPHQEYHCTQSRYYWKLHLPLARPLISLAVFHFSVTNESIP